MKHEKAAAANRYRRTHTYTHTHNLFGGLNVRRTCKPFLYTLADSFFFAIVSLDPPHTQHAILRKKGRTAHFLRLFDELCRCRARQLFKRVITLRTLSANVQLCTLQCRARRSNADRVESLFCTTTTMNPSFHSRRTYYAIRRASRLCNIIIAEARQ